MRFSQTVFSCIARRKLTLDSLPDEDRLLRIRPAGRLLREGKLTIRLGTDPAYIDDDHLSVPAVMSLRELFEGVLQASGQ